MTRHLLATAVLAAAGCTAASTVDAPDPLRALNDPVLPRCMIELPIDPSPTGGNCPIHSCGNAAKIYGSFIEALDTDGERVQDLLREPFRIKRGLLTNAGGACRGVAGLSLEVRDGGFVGVAGGGAVKCTGRDLVGARFVLEQQLVTGRVPRINVTIGELGSVDTWRPDSETWVQVPTYDLIADAPNRIPALPAFVRRLCRQAPWMGRGDFPTPEGRDDPGWDRPTYHALLVQGETYNRDATVRWTGDSWFNIGCAGSGISKLRLLGIDPMKNATGTGQPQPGHTTAPSRQATLKMLTAKYCGATSVTKDGTWIYLVRYGDDGDAPPLGIPGMERVGPIESRWGANGALCLSHLRLWSRGSKCASSEQTEAEAAERIRQFCKIPACDESAPCRAASTRADGTTVWRTCTHDHVPQ